MDLCSDFAILHNLHILYHHRSPSLLTQLLTDGIYRAVAGITYIDIFTAYSTDPGYVPDLGDYQPKNVPATSRQKVLVDGARIEVVFDGGG